MRNQYKLYGNAILLRASISEGKRRRECTNRSVRNSSTLDYALLLSSDACSGWSHLEWNHANNQTVVTSVTYHKIRRSLADITERQQSFIIIIVIPPIIVSGVTPGAAVT
jgi:hypothetical protein